MVEQKDKLRIFRSNEEVFSMLLGLAIVVVVFVLIFNYYKKSKGNVEVPGISDTIAGQQNVSPTQAKPSGVVASAKTTATPPEVIKNEDVKTDEYIVKKGDSLWKISISELGSGFRWEEIRKINNLKYPGNLAIGQKLNVPVVENKSEIVLSKGLVQIEGNDYVVEKNDSLSKIALRAYGDTFAWNKIWGANKMLVVDPNIILVGWKLTIPR